MLLVLGTLNAFIFFALALLHFYWAAGGRWGVKAAVPSLVSGDSIFSPSTSASVIVGLGLCLMAVIHLGNINLFSLNAGFPMLRYGTIAIGIIFLLRAIGDFKWIGLFKKVTDTPFGKNDSRYYVPLCLFLSFSAFLMAITIS
jgi:hypothetical protein